MPNKIVALAIAAALLGGCASPPKPTMPKGSARTPVNDPAEIEAYKQRAAAAQEEREQRSSLVQTVAALSRQVAELQMILAAQQHNAELDRPKAWPVRAMSAAPDNKMPAWVQSAAAPAAKTEPHGKEGLRLDGEAVVFRLSHDYAHTAFEPSPLFAKNVLRAARESARIIIRGRTDAQWENEGDRRIALERALAAKRYLVLHGIPTSKIRVFSLSAGDHLADNSTDEGRAINRRVEIETYGMDPADYKSYAALAGVVPQ